MEIFEYNATIVGKIILNPDLIILRIKSDTERKVFKSGQYTRIGLKAKEARSNNSEPIIESLEPDEMIIRSYSIASANNSTKDFEFYISQVKTGQLTPRLFNLNLGDRIWIDENIIGIFSLADVPREKNIVMIATGTGLAPYISFLRSHLSEHRDSKLAIIHGAGAFWDLGYYSELNLLSSAFSNFYYIPSVLKVDPIWNGRSERVELILMSDEFKELTGIDINPDKTHVFLCGNPKMIESVRSILCNKDYCVYNPEREGALHIDES